MDQQNKFLTAEEFNELAPIGTTVAYYPRFVDGSPDPRHRDKQQVQTPARQVKNTGSVVCSLDRLSKLVSIAQLRICERYWVRIHRRGRVGHWIPMELDELELEEIKDREIAAGHSIDYQQKRPEEVSQTVAETLFGRMIHRVIESRLELETNEEAAA